MEKRFEIAIMFSGRHRHSREERNGFVKADVIKYVFVFMYLRDFTLSLHFTPGPQPAVRSPQPAFYTDRIRNLSANIDFDRLRNVCFWFAVRLVSRQKTSVTRARFSLQKVILSFAKGLYEVLRGHNRTEKWTLNEGYLSGLFMLVASALNGSVSVLTGSEVSRVNALKQHRQDKY